MRHISLKGSALPGDPKKFAGPPAQGVLDHANRLISLFLVLEIAYSARKGGSMGGPAEHQRCLFHSKEPPKPSLERFLFTF